MTELLAGVVRAREEAVGGGGAGHDDDADQDFIFGRGAIDDKQVRVPVLSSITNLTKWQNSTLIHFVCEG